MFHLKIVKFGMQQGKSRSQIIQRLKQIFLLSNHEKDVGLSL